MIQIWEMWVAGVGALRTRWRLALALYGVQLGVSLVFMLAVARTLNVLFGQNAVIDRAAAGDAFAVLAALQHKPGVLTALVSTGVALAVGYGVLSWYLSAGTLGVLAGDPFAEAAGARFFAFFRIWLWSLVPYVVAMVAVGVGIALSAANRDPVGALTWFDFVGRPVLAAMPGLVIAAIASCVTCYAQAILAVERKRGATRAWFRAWRLVFTRPWPLLHYLVYLVLWALITALYAQGMLGTAFAGFGGALLLFAIRQAVAGSRFALRFATVAGQVAATDRYVRSA